MSTANVINLYSDTQTRPCAAMREAMAGAEVGDEQRGEDPTVNRLCEQVAGLLGKPAALFLPSGTMCNEIAILVHCRPGDEIYAHERAHIIDFEAAGPAAFAGTHIRPLTGPLGTFSAQTLSEAIGPVSRYAPQPRLVEIEQSTNMGGGAVWPLAQIRSVCEVARAHGLAVHMDGARLLNAVIASGVSARDHGACVDSIWIDLSKGLGCPVGAVLAGSHEFIEQAWRWKHRMGGAMRQAGIIAAAGIYALEHNVERLAEDHANARRFAELIAGAARLTVTPNPVQTNILFIDLGAGGPDAREVSAGLATQGVIIGAVDARRLRVVTHLDVNRAQVEQAARALLSMLG
ncbi:MAG: threonine aldolase family protein [Gammaproteobacteria bacterium]|nr:threonine aldolase family protein [Gammaproteobacteria bacterium]